MINLFSKKSHQNPVINNYLQSVKFSRNTKLKDIEFLVLDFETTGLNYKKDKIISMGWIVIKNLSIDLKSIKHTIINPKDDLKNSVLIHKITDDEVSYGISISKAMTMLVQMMQNKVIIVHFDNIEKNFINYICKKLYGIKKLPIRMIDTLKIQIKKNKISGNNAENFRLYNLRDKYNLPRYKAHNSAIDALATAELFLAQISYINNIENLKLKDVL